MTASFLIPCPAGEVCDAGRGDKVVVHLSGSPHDAEVLPRHATVAADADGYTMQILDADTIDVFGSEEQHGNRATIRGQAGPDQLEWHPRRVWLSGDGYTNRLVGFATVDTHGEGGDDTASFYGTANDEQAIIHPSNATVTSTFATVHAVGFREMFFVDGKFATRFEAAGDSDTRSCMGRQEEIILKDRDLPSPWRTRWGGQTTVLGYENVAVKGEGGPDQLDVVKTVTTEASAFSSSLGLDSSSRTCRVSPERFQGAGGYL